jgi:hypothetical protein
MANKKYPDFPAGTYDTAKIFLQSDPVTGALEKVNLPAVGGAPYLAALLYLQSDGTPDMTILHNDFGGALSFNNDDVGTWSLIPVPDWPCDYTQMDFQYSVGFGDPANVAYLDLDAYGWFFNTLNAPGGSPANIDANIYVRITSFA